MYSGFRIVFDENGSWSFNGNTARNILIFGVDNNSSSYTGNLKNDFLLLGKGDNFNINGSSDALEKKNVDFSKTKTIFFFKLHYNSSNSYLFVNGK